MPAHRKPTALKLVTGTHRPKRADRPHTHNPNEPKPIEGNPEKPEHLSTRAAEAWDRFAPLLSDMGVLTVADTAALERLCECYADLLDAQDALTLRGARTYESRSITGGTMHRTYPEVAMIADADRRFRGYLADFGLTPAARTRVSATGLPDAAKQDRYFG